MFQCIAHRILCKVIFAILILSKEEILSNRICASVCMFVTSDH
nr:MAG TPA: hypothetical protein [Caudoviricetes sp.]